MAGTSQGVKNSWATRRELYGPSGRAPKPEGQKRARNESGKASRASTSSRNMNRSQRMNTPRDLPFNADLARALREREEVLKSIRKFDRDKRTGKFPHKPSHDKFDIRQPPAWAIEQRNHLEQEAHDDNVKRLRELDEYIKRMKEWLITQERKKYGRRYTTA